MLIKISQLYEKIIPVTIVLNISFNQILGIKECN
jgi:hypothetical protein